MTRICLAAQILVLAFSLGGCLGIGAVTDWPDSGTGGLAERRPTTYQSLADLEYRMWQLEAAGAREFAAGDFAEAELLMIRIRREVAAGLNMDADTHISLLEHRFDVIERRLGDRSQPPHAQPARERS
jgi:hypothetical protein